MISPLEILVVSYRSEAYLPALLRDLSSMSALPHSVRVFNNNENRLTLTAIWNDFWRSSSSEYVCLLNPDIELSPDWDEKLVGCLDSRPEVGITMGNRYLPREGQPFRRRLNPHRRGQAGLKSYSDLGTKLEGFYAVVIRRSVLESLAGFDERFRFYYQDSDLQLRCLEILGKHTTQVDHCQIGHVGRVSTLEAVRRGDLDVDEEWRHAEWIKGQLKCGSLRPWHALTEEERRSVREHPAYGRLPRVAASGPRA